MEDLIIELRSLHQQLKQLNNQEKQFYNFEDAAKYLGMAKSTLYKHTAAHKISFYKPNGKLIIFKVEDLNDWLTAREIACVVKRLNKEGGNSGK
jgi:excisionase family DNA binding protein